MATAEATVDKAVQTPTESAPASKETVVTAPEAKPAAVPPAEQKEKPAAPAPAPRTTILTDEPAKPADGEQPKAEGEKKPDAKAQPAADIKLELPKDTLLDAKDIE